MRDVDSAAWGGVVALVEGLVSIGAFGLSFPELCPDGQGTAGTDERTLGLAIRSEIPELEWPISSDSVPATETVMDLLEFCHDHVAEPTQGGYHSYWGHYHLSFDRDAGRSEFRARVSRILSRNRLAFEIGGDGRVSRLAAPVLRELIGGRAFATGDDKLDQLLEVARGKFFSPNSSLRREALEKLWDAWERVKTIEPGKDKRASTKAVLDKAAREPTLRAFIEAEARALTDAGNTFHIRHSEKSQIEIEADGQADYLFYRLFALIWLLIEAR